MSNLRGAKSTRTAATRTAATHRASLVAAAVLLAVLAVGCSDGERVAVTAGAPPAGAAPAAPAASSFQGSVTSVDTDAGSLVVAVKIVWTPKIEARAEDRRVVVDGATGWQPATLGLANLHAGDEVQVDADPGWGDTWRAVRVRLFDIE